MLEINLRLTFSTQSCTQGIQQLFISKNIFHLILYQLDAWGLFYIFFQQYLPFLQKKNKNWGGEWNENKK
jgi:hypothetical protein